MSKAFCEFPYNTTYVKTWIFNQIHLMEHPAQELQGGIAKILCAARLTPRSAV